MVPINHIRFDIFTFTSIMKSGEMMKCPHCGQEHPNDSLSCPVTDLRIVSFECPNCGQVVTAGSESCPYCAASFTPPAALRAGAPSVWLALPRFPFWIWIAFGMAGALVVISAGVLLFWNGAFSPPSQPVPPTQRLPVASTVTAPNPTETTGFPGASATPAPSASPSPSPSPVSAVPPPCTTIGQTWTRLTDQMEMVCVPAGSFQIGMSKCTFTGCGGEVNGGIVALDAYWIDRTEVTNRMFTLFTEATGFVTGAERGGASEVNGIMDPVFGANWRHPQGPGSSLSGLDDHPVVQVNWYAADAYCKWAGGSLPTEAQWENAARDADGRLFPWGNELPKDVFLNAADSNLPVAWARSDMNDGYRYTAPVGTYPAGVSPYGAQDMAGNAWEWTRTLFKSYPYAADDGREIAGEPTVTDRMVMRGGSWYDDYGSVRSTLRFGGKPDQAHDAVGFRCAFP
jgi:formylglycine-generating enzyme required for sulfatase activity/predicted RNA-binding Zn-ribbon protein involved in translation (DUF1610 family)